MRFIRTATALLAGAALVACSGAGDAPLEGAAPSFSPSGKHDGAADSVRYLQGIGTNATVRGRFQSELQYRGFTFRAEAGQQLDIQLTAQAEQNGLLLDRAVQTQVLLYGPAPSEDALFDQVVADSGMVQQAEVQHEVQQDGVYLIAAAREEQAQNAQFELEVQCQNCQDQQPVEKLCTAGRLYIEGSKQKSQEWDRCEVVVLEPTTLIENETLVIGPDVHVRAHYYITDYHPEGWGETQIRIDGTLDMRSEKGHEIVFESNVEGKQWVGIRVNTPGTQMHDFVLRDTHQGLEIYGNSVRVTDAEFELNRWGVNIAGASGVELEGLRFHDNRTGVVNHAPNGNGGWSNAPLDNLFLLDSEFYANDWGISLSQVSETYIDGVDVHDNTHGIFIGNRTQNRDPEEAVNIGNCVVRANDDGVQLNGNAVIDGCEITDNRTFGVLSVDGWHKVKNSRLTGNGADCEDAPVSQRQLQSCGALVALPDAHTVFRNNLIEDNAAHGVVLMGRDRDPQRRTAGVDPAVLNSVIKGNGGYGVVLVDAPVYSVEFNHIEANTGAAQIGLVFTQTYANTRYNRQPQPDADGQYSYQATLGFRNNRLQRNNIYPGANPFLGFEFHVNTNIRLTEHIGFWREVEMSQNFVEGLTDDDVTTTWPHQNLKIVPLLVDEESTAGLIRELPFD